MQQRWVIPSIDWRKTAAAVKQSHTFKLNTFISSTLYALIQLLFHNKKNFRSVFHIFRVECECRAKIVKLLSPILFLLKHFKIKVLERISVRCSENEKEDEKMYTHWKNVHVIFLFLSFPTENQKTHIWWMENIVLEMSIENGIFKFTLSLFLSLFL